VGKKITIDKPGIVDSMKKQWSCEWQEGGLTFGTGHLHVCCIWHHLTKGWPPLIENFDGGPLLPKLIVGRRAELNRRNQDPLRDPLCAGCSRLQCKTWRKRKFLFDLLNFSHFTKCQLKCKYCFITKPGFKHHQNPIRLTPVLDDMIKRKMLSPKSSALWGGGEPTILPDFDEIFTLLEDFGSLQVLNTNGVRLSGEVVNRLSRGRVSVVVSVDAGTRSTYRVIKGVDVFDQVMKNITTYAEVAPGKVAAKIILIEENAQEVDRFLDTIQKAGVTHVIADMDAATSSPSEEIIMAARRLVEHCKQRGMWYQVGACGIQGFPEVGFRQRVLERKSQFIRRVFDILGIRLK
jgi:sulfatase maturation enzyme AslB (radical SAM superfamily)